jgi:hypothetical protein
MYTFERKNSFVAVCGMHTKTVPTEYYIAPKSTMKHYTHSLELSVFSINKKASTRIKTNPQNLTISKKK